MHNVTFGLPVLIGYRWGVIYNYSRLDYIETVSTTGISRDDLVEELVRRQSNALNGIELGLALSEIACTENYCGRDIRSNDRSGSHPGRAKSPSNC